jgi:hypothetical protein
VGFIVSGVLFLVRASLDLVVGPPPATVTEMLAWASTRRLPLSITNEVLFFAATPLVPAVVALYDSLAGTDRGKAAVGCGLFAVTIPIMVVVDVVHGRLVYPGYNIHNTPDIAGFVVAIYYGGLHAVGILLGIATFALSLAMRRGVYGSKIACLGFAAGACDIVGAFPWVIGPFAILVSQAVLAAWFLAVGARLHGMA